MDVGVRLQMEGAIREYLDGMSKLRRHAHPRLFEDNPSIKYAGVEEFVLMEGRIMWPPPSDRHRLRKGIKNQCFKNATMVSMYSRMKYVEGFFVLKNLMIPLHHAWNVAEDGYAVDATIGWDIDACFFGIVIEPSDLSRLILKNGFYGVLSDGIMATDLSLGQDPHFPYRWKRGTSTLTGDSHAASTR